MSTKILNGSRSRDQKRARCLLTLPTSGKVTNKFESERIPTEVWLRIFSLVVESACRHEEVDPFHVGWRDEVETLIDVEERSKALAPIRLVSRHWLHLSTPLYFQKLLVPNRNDEAYSLYIRRLTHLLAASPPPRVLDGHREIPYGQHVREIVLKIINPCAISDLLHSIHQLVPHVVQLSSLRLSQLPSLLSPAIVFPELNSLSELSATPIPTPSTTLCRHMNGSSPIAVEESFLSLVNHHPLLRRLSCRGFRLDPSRFVDILRSSRLSVPLVDHLNVSGAEFSGLQSLHFGLDCILDLELLKRLPSATPFLEQLHIDAGCHITDEHSVTGGSERWNLLKLVGELPSLSKFSLIGRQALPNSDTDWWECEDILKVGKKLTHLNLRIGSMGEGILSDMQQLEGLNIWHNSPVHGYEGWGIIPIKHTAEVGNLGRALCRVGLAWPSDENGRKDIWMKLKSLTSSQNHTNCSSQRSSFS
ncbi:hypothetical protein DFH28DRAFT_576104 [Melampsora americana]|nr:hypothetical protein DFH28DRAFT_576104 [Melampsora americana]